MKRKFKTSRKYSWQYLFGRICAVNISELGTHSRPNSHANNIGWIDLRNLQHCLDGVMDAETRISCRGSFVPKITY